MEVWIYSELDLAFFPGQFRQPGSASLEEEWGRVGQGSFLARLSISRAALPAAAIRIRTGNKLGLLRFERPEKQLSLSG